MVSYTGYRMHQIAHYISNDGEIYCEKIVDVMSGAAISKKTWSIYAVNPDGTEEWLVDFPDREKKNAEHLIGILTSYVKEEQGENQITTGKVARMLNVPRYKILYQFEHKRLPEPPRVSGRRMIPISMIPLIAEKLGVVYLEREQDDSTK